MISSHSPTPSCTFLPRLQPASPTGDLRLEIACVASVDPELHRLAPRRGDMPALLALCSTLSISNLTSRRLAKMHASASHRGLGFCSTGRAFWVRTLQCTQSTELVRMCPLAHTAGAVIPSALSLVSCRVFWCCFTSFLNRSHGFCKKLNISTTLLPALRRTCSL
jgi:hypothetical protein